MRFTTFYFSGTGNTEWAVKQFHKIITDVGQEGQFISIENSDIKETSYLLDIINQSDYIGFANPIYGGNIPPVMKAFIVKTIDLLKEKESYSKQMYYINTFAYVNGFGPICTKKLFCNTAFKMNFYVNIRLCNNISRPGLKTSVLNKDILELRKKKALVELHTLVSKILAGKRYITGIGPYLIPNIVIRKVSINKIRDNYKELSVNMKTCSICLLCVKNCPTKSIKYIDSNIKFLPECSACMRCYNNCPTFSILFNGIYADPKVYQRYQGPI